MTKIKTKQRLLFAGILIIAAILFELIIAIIASNFRNFNMRRFLIINNPDEIRIYYKSKVTNKIIKKEIKDISIIREFLMNIQEDSKANFGKVKKECDIEFFSNGKRLLSKAKVYLSGNIPYMLFNYRFQKSHNKINPQASKMIEEWIEE